MQHESSPRRDQGEQIKNHLESSLETIAKQAAAFREAAMAEASRFGVQYPQIADALREHAERISQEFEAMQSPDHPRTLVDELAKKEKRDAWNFLTILAQAVPDLPIVEMHDEVAARIDDAVRKGKQQKEVIKGKVEAAKSTMGNVTIDYHIGGDGHEE